jgi:hypothetical protein
MSVNGLQLGLVDGPQFPKPKTTEPTLLASNVSSSHVSTENVDWNDGFGWFCAIMDENICCVVNWLLNAQSSDEVNISTPAVSVRYLALPVSICKQAHVSTLHKRKRERHN